MKYWNKNSIKLLLKMIWRIIRDKQIVVITENHGTFFYSYDTVSDSDAIFMCNKVITYIKIKSSHERELLNK